MATDARARPAALRGMLTWLAEPVDAASCAALRVLFGAVMLVSTLRFAARGWIDAFYVAPRFHFAWPGFEWLSPWPAWGLYLHFTVLALAALCVMLGLFYRASAALFFVAFSCIELFDQTYYLNHYYLVSLVAGLSVVLPLHRGASLDALRKGGLAVHEATVPRWVPLLLRAQLAIVYLFAGLAKLDADWLLRAQPLTTWLAVHADLPVVGALLTAPGVALAMSWAGAAFDLSIAFLLLAPRTRAAAFAAVVVFHTVTGLLLPIGIFPWLMIALTPIFFAPDWPRRLLAATLPCSPALAAPAVRPLHPATALVLCGYLALQVALPLRHLLYPGPVNWTEEGFRFAWRVMLIEKTGHVELRVRDPHSGRQWSLSPRDELTAMQLQMMSTQPDMIAQYARHVARSFSARGHRGVEVYADAWAALNGRAPQRLIDPHANLARAESQLAPRSYVLPLAQN